ncbi:MAG: hypothetical protein GY884_10115 [Proteobacteria bacterium]|nr:hypothetical protein [Pseudomonadota bacterium]
MLALLALLACGDKDPGTDSGEVFLDEDGDGFTSDVDCDDTDPDHNPDTPETCNGADDNCNGVIDDDPVDGITFWFDADGDGYGGDSISTVECSAREFYYEASDDCDDADNDVNPGATEVCDDDDVDEDCDGTADDADDSTDLTTGTEVWVDADEDGYGEAGATSTWACEPEGTVADNDGDCMDTESAVNPGATEVCDNGWDDDCNGTTNTCSPNGDVALDDYEGDTGSSTSLFGAAVSQGVDGQVAVGAPGHSGGDGQVQIVEAGFTVTKLGGSDEEAAGSAVALADIDGDGDGDLLVGAPDEDDGDGRVYLVEGPFSAGSLSTSATEEWGGSSNSAAGSAVLLFDNDGTAGMAYGAVGDGAVFIESTIGGSSRQISIAGGGSVLAAADWDGDGVDEVLIGNPDNDYTYVAGANGSGGDDSLYGTGLGSALTGGDLDGDGTEDVVTGSKSAGEVEVYSSSSSSWLTVTGEGGFGAAVSVLDLDADGANDLVVGASAATNDANSQGAVYVFYAPGSGTLELADADAALWGDGDFASAGSALGHAGDIDSDGDDDLMVGAPGTDSLDGAAYIVTGGGF